MDQENISMGTEEVFPILFIPKQCTKLEMNCNMSENMYINLCINSADTEGNPTCIYSGFCNVKLIESCNIYIYPTETVDVEQENTENSSIDCDDINQMPVILSDANVCSTQPYNHSQVWIDPSRSPHVYNHYDMSSKQTYSIVENTSCITVQQHNTYITQKVYSYDRQSQSNDIGQNKTVPEARNPQHSPEIFYEDESESEIFLSQLSKRNQKGLEKRNFASHQGKNDALKQLMSSDIQSSSKQRKTILYLGEDSTSGQTIQNILYTDPKVKCSGVASYKEVIEKAQPPVPKKKKYQCDKCKRIFERISEFRQHMVGNYTYYKVLKNKDLTCSECGKKFWNNFKYQMHCLGHGDPNLECPKCHKVYASRNTLKIHMKIHNRKYPCAFCSKSYPTSEAYKMHLKVHSKHACQYDGCFFMADAPARRDAHHEDHIEDYCVDNHNGSHYDVHVDNDHSKNDVRGEDDHQGKDDNNDFIDEQSNITKDTEFVEFMDDVSEDFEQDLITTELKTEISVDQEGIENEGRNNNEDLDVNNKTEELEMNNNVEELQMHDKTGELEMNKTEEVEMNKTEKVEMNNTEELEVNNKTEEMETNDSTEIEGNHQDERVKRADSVIAKVMSSKIFLLNSKTAKKHVKNNKTCQVCSKSFDRVGDLKRHLIEHIVKSTLAKAVSSQQGILNITCEICQAECFNSIDKYKAHLREHAKLTLYKCTFCDKSFSDSSNFSKHKKIHGVSYFQCDLCRRRFNSKVMITRHLELHTKNKPLNCKHCQRVFHFESMLKKHIKSVHNKPTITRFSCRFCNEGFRTLKNKWDHEWAVHNIRKIVVDCLVCGAKYRKYSELKRHCLNEHEMEIPTQKRLDSNRLADR